MPSLNYDSCGILDRSDIRPVRYEEEGYTTDGLDVLCSRIGPLTEEATADGTGYLNIPPALHMWNADEPYYTQIADIELYPELSQSQFNDNPYTGNTFVDLWRAFDGSSGTLDDWDAEEYQEPSTCQEVVEYAPGFMRSPIPSIQFIVDTASVSINRVITNINTNITNIITDTTFINAVTEIVQNMVNISITSKTPCITVTSDPASGSSDFELDWDKCCFNVEEYIDILGFNGMSIPFPDCPGKGKQIRFISSPSGCATTLAKLTADTVDNIPYSRIDPLACPPDASKDYALVMRSGVLGWMEIASCEEAEEA